MKIKKPPTPKITLPVLVTVKAKLQNSADRSQHETRIFHFQIDRQLYNFCSKNHTADIPILHTVIGGLTAWILNEQNEADKDGNAWLLTNFIDVQFRLS